MSHEPPNDPDKPTRDDPDAGAKAGPDKTTEDPGRTGHADPQETAPADPDETRVDPDETARFATDKTEPADPDKTAVDPDPSAGPDEQTVAAPTADQRDAGPAGARGTRLDEAKRKTKAAAATALRWLLIGLGYAVTLALLGLLVLSSVEAYQGNAATRWETFGATGFSVLIVAYGIYRRFNPWRLAGFCALVLALLVVYSALRFSTTDPNAFTLFGRPTETMLNPAFLAAILGLLVGVWMLGRWPIWIRALVSLVLLYCGSAFLYGALHNVGLEQSFLGVDFFARIPYYFLQPTYFTIQVLFPIALIYLLVRWFIARRSAPQRAPFLLLLAVLVFLTDVVGFAAMGRNRVPNAASALFPPAIGVGEATTTFSDEFGQTVSVRVTTRDYEQRKTDESAEFYSMALSYLGSEGDRRRFNLSVKDRAGRDVLFLDSSDFEFFEDGVPQTPAGVNFELGGVTTGQNIILLLDHSGSMEAVIDQLKLAAKSFIDQKDRNDRVLLIPFAKQPSPQPISDDPAELKAQVDEIAVAGGTGLYRAILKAYELAEELEGTTTLVVMADGTADADDKTAANEQALRSRLADSSVRVYSVGLGTEEYLDVDFLAELARQGGGKFFLTDSADELKAIYQAIGAELQSNYTAYYDHSVSAPTVAIESPAGPMVVADTPFVAQVPNAKEARLDKVELFVNARKLAEIQGSEATRYETLLEVGSIGVGEHLLRVVATSLTGETGEATHRIEIRNPVEFRLLRPIEGDTVGERVPIEAELILRGDLELTELVIQIDEETVAALGDRPFIYTWDSSTAEAGTHTINAFAVLSDGSTQVASADIRIDKAMSIRFASPEDGAELPLGTQLAIHVDNERAGDPVESVEFFLGDRSIGTTGDRPFRVAWDTSMLEPGRHTIRAQATTRSGATANASISTTVSTGSLVVDLQAKDAPPTTPAGPAAQPARVFLPPENVEIVLDASNSMWGQIKGGSKIDIAKQVLRNIVGMIPDGTNVALRVYGNQSAVARGNCTDTDLLQPLAPINRPQVLAKLGSVTPRGKTLIAYSLDQVALDLKNAGGSSVVLLITDGIESCDGDPIDAARRLHEQGINTKLHVISYDVDDATQLADLGAIAEAGGGKFFKADSSVELQDAIVEAATVEYVVLDGEDRVALSEKVSPVAHPLRAGTYRLRINVDPPIELPSLEIEPGQTRRFVLVQEDKSFRLEPRDSP